MASRCRRVGRAGRRERLRSAPGAAAAAAAAGATAPNAIEGGPELAQLVVGGESPHETVAAVEIALRGEAGRLLDALFPPQHPQMDNQAL